MEGAWDHGNEALGSIEFRGISWLNEDPFTLKEYLCSVECVCP